MAQDNVIKFTKLSEELNTVISKQIDILGEAANNLDKLNTSYGKLPSEYVKSMKDALNVQKQKSASDKEIIPLEKQKTQVIKSKIPTLRQLASLRKQENAALEKSINTYSKVQEKIKQMTPVYNDLAAKQQLGVKLTAKEEAQLTLLTNRLTKYRGVLNKVNKDYGNYSLEVGNYAKGTKNLEFSIAQISRELPNFGQSFQIGVLSLTNNIGQLIDGIKQVKTENEKLKNQGKSTKSVFKTILGSIFSFQTLLFVGVGLFSTYSKEISKWAQSLFEGEKYLRSNYNVLKDLGEETSNTIGRLQSLVGVVKDVTVSEEKRLKAIRDLNNEFPEFNTNIINEKNNTELLNNELDEYIDLIVKRAKLKSLEGKIGNETLKIIKLEEKRNDLLKKLDKDDEIVKNNQIKRLAELKYKLDNEKDEKARFKIIGEYDRSYKLLTFTQQRYLKVLVDESRTKDKLNKLIKTSVGLSESEKKALKGTVDYYNELISANNNRIKSKKTTNDLNEVRSLQEQNKEYQKQIDLILNISKATRQRAKIKSIVELDAIYPKDPKEFEEYAKKVIKVLEENFNVKVGKIDKIELPPLDTVEFEAGLNKLQIATDEFINKLGFKSLENSPFSSLKTFFDGTFEDLMLGTTNFAEEFAVTFNAIGEVAKQTFSTISQLGEQNYQQDLNILQKRYENQLVFAGEGTAARERLEERYEERRAVIQKKQAEAQKKQALFNAGVTTAQSALAAYASQLIPGDPTSLIRAQIAAGIASAFGLAQVGFIASQQIPEFKDGVRDFEGGNAIVGDGGVSEIIRTNKGVYATPSTDTLVNLPKGSDVFKNHDEYYNSVMGEMGVLPSMPKINVMNNGIKAVEMDAILSKHFSNIQTNQTTIDKNGLKTYVKKQNSKTTSNNNRVTFKGFSV